MEDIVGASLKAQILKWTPLGNCVLKIFKKAKKKPKQKKKKFKKNRKN